MRIPKGLAALAVVVIGVAAFGASLVFAAHENGVASNGGCDEFYWATREPAENMQGEVDTVTATTAADAQRVIALTADVPCDGAQLVMFNASASAAPNTALQTYIRMTCLEGDCAGDRTPAGGGTFARPAQVCAPDNMEDGNNRGIVLLTGNGGRTGVSQHAVCGATPPGAGQIAAGTYLIEVLAYQTAESGTGAGGGARFDERVLSVEMWGQPGCFARGDARDRSANCGENKSRGH